MENPNMYAATNPISMFTFRSINPLVSTAERLSAILFSFSSSPMKKRRKINPIWEKKWLISLEVTSESPLSPSSTPPII